jgi:hypothetical protein
MILGIDCYYMIHPLEMFFVAHFLEGLKEEIHYVIAIHHPQDMDTVCALALMQEEEADNGKHKPMFKTDHSATKTNLKITQSADKGKDNRKLDDTNQKGKIKWHHCCLIKRPRDYVSSVVISGAKGTLVLLRCPCRL